GACAFVRLSGIADINQLDIGLRTSISALTGAKMDEATVVTIEQVCKEQGLWQPGEGRLPDILIYPLLKGIQKVGHDWIWCGDEFGTERKLESISELANSSNISDDYTNFFMHHNELLVTTYWELFHALFDKRDQ
ncbi:DUF2711 domain-containing protein, partial [Virgibacillus pantothenticus]